MRNNYKVKKLAMRVAAMGLALVMVISLIGTLSLNASAAVSLRGIEKIKNTGSLSILEIVPESGSGSVGYYVSGQEPTANWYSEVGKEATASARKTYADNLFAKLQSAQLMSTDTTSPLRYKGEYVEYKPWAIPTGVDKNSLTPVNLATAETQIVRGDIQPCTPGTGYYTKDDNYKYDTSSAAKFIENVSSYEYIGTPGETAYYYHVDFKQVFLYEHESEKPTTTKEGIEYIYIADYLTQYKSIPLYTKVLRAGLPCYTYEGTLTTTSAFKPDIEINDDYGYYIAIPDYTTISSARNLVVEISVPTVTEGENAGNVHPKLVGQTIYEADSTNANNYIAINVTNTFKPDSSKTYYAQDIMLPVTNFTEFVGQTLYVVDNSTGTAICVTTSDKYAPVPITEGFTPTPNETYYAHIKVHSYFANTVPGKPYREADTTKGEVPFFKKIDGFRYVDDGSGDYNFVQSSTGSVEEAIAYDVVYADGGYTNNDWFKRYVMDMDEEDGFENFFVTVTSVTPNDPRLTAANVSSYDLVVISAGYDLNSTKTFEYTNDFSTEVYSEIVKMPRVVDTSFKAHSSLSNSNLVKLKNGMTTPSVTAENVYYFAPTPLVDNTTATRLVTKQFHTTIAGANSTNNNPYVVVADEIKYENLLRDSSQEPLSTEISMASCFRYVINPYRVINKKTALNVLDIQPVPSYDESTSEEKGNGNNGPLTVATVLSWLPDSMQDQLAKKDANGNFVKDSSGNPIHNITITHMSTAALVGKIEDITEQYDLIYIGTAVSSDDKSYLNTHLDAGYQYANIGKAVNNNILVRGLLATDTYNANVDASMRYSGNDLTPTKRDELIAFADARLPIVLAEDLVTGDGTVETTPPREFNVTLELTEDKTQIRPKITFNQEVSSKDYKIVSYNWECSNNNNSLGSSATAPAITPKDGYSYRCTVSVAPTVGTGSDTARSKYYTYDATYTSDGEITTTGSWTPAKRENNDEFSGMLTGTPNTKEGSLSVTYTFTGSTGYGTSITPTYNWYDANGTLVSTSGNGTFRFPNANTPYHCEIAIRYQYGFWDGRQYVQGTESYTVIGPTFTWTAPEISSAELKNPTGTATSGEINIGKYVGGSGNLALDDDKVDVNSLMHDALSDALGNTDANIFSEAQLVPASRTDANEQKLVNALNLSRPAINMPEANQPPRYDPENLDTNGTVSGDCNGTLEFQFQIENITDPDPANTRYRCNLYIDQNGDGRHSEKELIPGITIESITNGTTKRVTNGTLQADENITYRVTRGLNSGNANQFSGIVAWKLQIVKVAPNGASEEAIEAAANVHASKKGYTYIQPTAPTALRVLQILNSNTLFNNGGVVDLSTPAENRDANGNLINWEDSYTKDTMSSLNQFRQLYWQLYNAGMYNITVETTKVDNLNYTQTGNRKTARTQASIFTELSGYDMIILGFHDCYGNLEANAANAVVDYINTGKALLFTHDTTSYWNNPDYDGEIPNQRPGWGYWFNQVIRDKVGLDRYGVTNPIYGKNQTSVSSSASYGVVASGSPGEINPSKATELQQAGYTVAYVPDKKDYSALETQGYTNSTVARNLKGRTDGNKETNAVSQVNEGQITEYPYDLPENMRIETTHNQYYQLNMNADDVVVWYCLGGEMTSSGDDYSDEKNDAANAYYIYNRGNITYSGAGHVERLSNQEAMLFVNTMIAAYRAGTGAAGVSFRTVSDDPASALLFPVQPDESGDTSLSSEQNAYFKISDRNLTEGNTLSVKLYYEVADQTTTNRTDGAVKIRDDITGTYTPYVKEVSLGNISRADTGASASANNLISDVLYKMVVPPSVLNYAASLTGLDHNVRIYLVATTVIQTDDDTTIVYTSFDDLSLVKLGLLRLE